jgi:beta-fructofuranosidase
LFAELSPVCNDGTRAWAPAVIRHEQRYFMFYGPSPSKLAVSRELNHWMGESVTLHGAPLEACHRDHMVIRLDESTWLLYATGLDEEGMGAISVFVSHDLRNWNFNRYALRTKGKSALRPAWGATESPFVIFYEGWYYLSITYTDCGTGSYHQTLLFRSLDPMDFGTFDADRPEESVAQRLHAHAPEYLYSEKEKSWFITTCGWHGFGIPYEGAVSIARLEWNIVS